MYNGPSPSNFKKRRKTTVNLKPINPIAFNTLSKLYRIFSHCFKQNEIITIYDKAEQNAFGIGEAINANTALEEHELKDISPLLREITSHFFENEFQQCRDAAPLLNEVNNIISRTSLPSACNSVSIECNRPRISEDELHKSILKEPPRETNSNASLKQETKPRISASGFLTTSFFSLPQAPEYSTYPVQINLRYAEEPLPNLTNTKSTQYCEQDFLNVSKSVRTSTRGLQSFSDNSTQSENLDNGNDCLEHSITQKVAHFFEITPIRKSRLKSTKHIFQGKIDRGTNTSDGMANAVEPMLLYVNSTGHFASTDDTTIESKFDSEDDNIRKIFKHAKSPKNQPQISTRNCCTSTSGTCICSEMCLKIKEWYKHLQKTPNPTFHARQITPSSHTMKTPSWNKQDCTLKYCPSGELSYETASNKKIDCEDAIKKLSEYLVADVKSVSSNIHNPSLEKLQDYVHERNLIDILNQRYPTFIGFQFNNNETKKIKYTINRKTPSVRRKKVPKIIIREKRKSCNNTRSRSDSENDRNARQQVKSKTSVISIATNSANMLEIRDIIESMLPKSSSRLKIVNSERYIRQQQCVRTSNQSTNTSSSHDDLLRLEVEKIVDELLHEIPSTSQMIYDRSLQNSLIPKPKQSWHTKDSFTSFTNELELHPIEDSLFRSVYTEKFPSQTVIPLFHRFKLGDIKKKIRTEEKVRFELAEPESEEHGQLSEEVKDETIPPENHPEEIQSADVDSQNPTGTEEVLRQYNLNKGFYAQIIQKTGSLEHPLVCSKISHSSTKSSVHSFIRSLLLCLKYGDSNTTLTNASIQCDDLDKSYSGNLKKKKRKHSLMPSLSTYSTQSSLQSEDEGWGEKKLSILEESEKIDKANMAFTPMNSVGIQALVVTRDKEVSPTLIPPKNKKSVKKNTHTQTKSTMEITYRDNSMQYDAPPQKQKDVVMYPSFDNKKVNEIQTGATHIGVLSPTMEQEIKINEVHNHKDNYVTDSNRNKYLMHPKNYLAPWFPNSIKKSLPFKTQSTITMYSNSVRYTPLKTSISTPLRARYQHLNKLNNGIRKTRKPKFRRVLYTDLGDGDVQKVAGNNPLVELTSHELNSSTISNTSLTSNSFPNIQETVNINRNLCSTKFSNDSHRDNHKNLTIFMYRADDMTNKNQQSSAQKEEGRDSYYSIDVKSSSRIQGDENQTSSQDDGSDIYKFKPDVTIIDEAYLERIIHLWLKSGLRQHVSQLSNLKLRPVYEWGRRYRVLPEEPQPVLETLDVEPVHITTERERRTRGIEESPTTSKEEELIPKETKVMDESIFPSVFTKLEKLGKDQRYKIEVSTSEGSTEELPEEPPKELPEEVKTEEESIEEPEDLETPVIEEEPEELPEQYPVEEPPEELPEQYSVEEQPEEEPELEEIVIVKDEELQKPRQLPEQKDETNIEPSLANVSDSIEKLTAEFADWLIAHGIPLWKISQIGIQTSLDVLPPYRAEPVPIQCYCDKPVTVDVDDSKETALQILKRILTKVLNQHSNYMTQKLITSVGALKNVRKKACLKMTNYKCIFEVKPVRDTKISEVSDGKITSTLSESEDRETTFETRESDVRQEMLNIINGIIDKLQTKIQEQITTESDVVAESFDEILEHGISESFSQKQFSNIFDKPEIITYEDRCQNTTRSVTFDEPTFSKKENQKQTGRSKLLKQISKYIRRSKNKAPKESVDSEAIDNNFRTVKDKTPQKKMKVRPSEKCNLQESCTAIGNRIHAPKKRRSIPMGKMGQKLYSTCEKAEAKLSEKLGISQEFCVRSGPSSSGETSDKRKKQKCGQKLKEETEPSENLGTSQEFCLCSVPSSSGETSDGRKKQKCEQKLKILIKSGTRDDEISKGASSKQKCFCDVTYISERSDYDSASTQRGSGGVSDAEDMRFQQMSYLDAVRDNRRFEDTHMRHLSTNTSIFYSSKRNQYTRRDSLEERREMSETYRRTCFCDFEESERQQTIFHRRYENKYQRNETKNRKNDNFEKYDNGQNFVPYKNEKFDQLEIEDNSYRESLIFAISSLERLIAKLHLKLDSCSNIGNRNIHHRTKSTLSNIYENVEICDANDIPTDDYASDTFSTIIETENSVVGEKQNFLTSESSPTLIPKTDNKIFLDKDSTKSDNSLLYKFSKLTKNLNSSESSCRNLRKEAHIKKSLDDFLTDIISSWVSSQSSLSEKSILDIRSRTSTLYDDYIMQHNNLSQTSTKCKKDESFSTITSELSFLGATNTSNEDISAFNLIERASQNSVDRYLKPEDVDDVREIIRLLSKLCPRVLCNYYVKKMQS